MFTPTSPEHALLKLKEGNQQYVNTLANSSSLTTQIALTTSEQGQTPFAIVLGCSDSRVPAELVFNQGLGELFVIRVAGNIVAPSQIGSVEFACQQYGTQLVVVMGHSYCGAIKATVEALIQDPTEISPNIAAIVDRVSPAVGPVLREHEHCEKAELVALATHANVKQSVASLKSRSNIIRDLVAEDKLKIVGCEYDIETGNVIFHD